MNAYESVAVGALCFAAGYISALAEFENAKRSADGNQQEKRKGLQAINFSHSPIDPAVGDTVIESLGDTAHFFLVEVKRDRTDDIRELKKLRNKDISPEGAIALLDSHAQSGEAHFLAWMEPGKQVDNQDVLVFAPYWKTLFPLELSWDGQREFAVDWLDSISRGRSGFGLLELCEYIDDLNNSAKGGAASGTERFAFSLHKGRAFLLTHQSVLQIVAKYDQSVVARQNANMPDDPFDGDGGNTLRM